MLSLTFDDGPDELWTPRILDELERCDARATFFVLGERVRAAPRIFERVLDAGHEIALHAHRHIRHTELSEGEIEADTLAALAALAELGAHPSRWRTPWGVRTPASERVAERNGLELVQWTLDTHDWRGDDAALTLAEIDDGVREGAIVLLHDGRGPGALREGCENTLAMIAPLCELAQRRGLTLEPSTALRP